MQKWLAKCADKCRNVFSECAGMPIRRLSASSPGVLTKVLKDWRSEQAAQKNTGHYLETPAVQWADLAWDLLPVTALLLRR